MPGEYKVLPGDDRWTVTCQKTSEVIYRGIGPVEVVRSPAPGIRTNLSGKFELSAIYMHGNDAVLLATEAPDFYLVSFPVFFLDTRGDR